MYDKITCLELNQEYSNLDLKFRIKILMSKKKISNDSEKDFDCLLYEQNYF